MKLIRTRSGMAAQFAIVACMALASTGCGSSAEKEDATTQQGDSGDTQTDSSNGDSAESNNQTDGNTDGILFDS